jgi:glyoxylase-like metal-dependent hydrolase (beta-lactamase superfamily II)
MLRVVEVADGVAVLQHQREQTNAVIIRGRDATVVVDSLWYPEDGDELAEATRKHGRLPHLLINTHAHLDHFAGNQAFSCPILATGTSQYMIGQRRRLGTEQLMRADARYRCLRVTPPTVGFTHSLIVDVGDEVLQVIETGGHMPGHCVVYLPTRSTLVASDLVFASGLPYLGDGDRTRYLEALLELRLMAFDVLVPGHGEPGGRDLLTRAIDTFMDLQNEVRALLRQHTDPVEIADEMAASRGLDDGGKIALRYTVQRMLKGPGALLTP